MTSFEYQQLKNNPLLVKGLTAEALQEFNQTLAWEKRSQAAKRAVRTKKAKYPAWPDRSRKHLQRRETR